MSIKTLRFKNKWKALAMLAFYKLTHRHGVLYQPSGRENVTYFIGLLVPKMAT